MKNKSVWILWFLLLVFVCAYNYFSTHIAEINAFRADYYFKHNKVELAQKYYEKAFEKGFSKPKQREIYINSIINSPLTIEAQEKIIDFLKYQKDDVARVKAKYFLYDIKREIHRSYPDNYISNAVYNQKIMRWGKLPITYSFIKNDNVPSYFVREIENAFTEWERATEQQIYFIEDNKNANILINFEEDAQIKENSSKYIVAYTTPNIETNELKNIEIIFYLKDFEGKYFTKTQVYNTALHEIVHALGFMGHSSDNENIMYLTKDSVSEKNNVRETITEADINTVKLLYKIKPEITNVEKPTGTYISSLVLGSQKDINRQKFKEAKDYVKNAPNLSAGYIDLAESYLVAKDYKNAIKYLNKALILATTDELKGMVYQNLAITYFYSDSLDKAKQNLLLSMNIEDTLEKHYLLAEIYVREGRQKEAIKEYTYLIGKDSDNIEYVISLANIYVIEHKYFKARKVLKDFVDKNPVEKNNKRLKAYGVLMLFL